MIFVIIGLWILSYLIVNVITEGDFKQGNTAVIKIKGPIMVENTKTLFTEGTSSTEIIRLLEKAEKNQNVKAILLDINSPGGSAVASDEIATKIKESNKTVIAWIRELGTSGAYWIASSSDKIIANKMSITGSIGVTASYLQFSGFLNDKNITYQRMVAGDYKDLGSPFKELTEEEKTLFQKQLDKIHDFFLEEIKENRNLDDSTIQNVKDGRFFLGFEAKELNLVDVLGGKKEVLQAIKKSINKTPELEDYGKRKGFFERITSTLSQKNILIGFEKEQIIGLKT